MNKSLSDSTLNAMKKSELIQYIRTLEHNCKVAVEFNTQQAENFKAIENRILSELEKGGVAMSTVSVPHNYFKAISVKRATNIVKGHYHFL